MSGLVSRGLIVTEDRLSKMVVTSKPAPQAVADRVISLLQREPVSGFHWKERAQWALRLARGDPAERGRRLLTDAGRSDARYVAHVATVAWRGGRETDGWGNPKHGGTWGRTLPTSSQWSHLRASIARIYVELNGGVS